MEIEKFLKIEKLNRVEVDMIVLNLLLFRKGDIFVVFLLENIFIFERFGLFCVLFFVFFYVEYIGDFEKYFLGSEVKMW